jgi:hypothetical protein
MEQAFNTNNTPAASGAWIYPEDHQEIMPYGRPQRNFGDEEHHIGINTSDQGDDYLQFAPSQTRRSSKGHSSLISAAGGPPCIPTMVDHEEHSSRQEEDHDIEGIVTPWIYPEHHQEIVERPMGWLGGCDPYCASPRRQCGSPS